MQVKVRKSEFFVISATCFDFDVDSQTIFCKIVGFKFYLHFMDYTELNQLFDEALTALEQWATTKAGYEQQIDTLTKSNQSLTALVGADDTEIKKLTDNINKLSKLAKTQSPATTPPVV